MQIYKCGLQVTTLGLEGSKGQGLRALSSGGLLVSSLCPASFPLRYEERHKQMQINTHLHNNNDKERWPKGRDEESESVDYPTS